MRITNVKTKRKAIRSICHVIELFVFSQLNEIIQDTTPPSAGEEHLAALTAADRTTWAETREKYFHTGVNRSSLEAIEKAAFVLILDDEEYQIGEVSGFINIFVEYFL